MDGTSDLDAALELASEYADRLLRSSPVQPVRSMPEMDGRAPTPWATADAMLLVHLAPSGEHHDDLIAMSEYLYDEQDDSGGWSSRGEICADATSMVLVALATCGEVQNDHVARGLDFLDRCTRAGGVRCTPGDSERPRVFPTAMAIWAFSALRDALPLSRRPELEQRIRAAGAWLRSNVSRDHEHATAGWNADGDPDRPSTIAHTGMGLFAMSLAGTAGLELDLAASRRAIERRLPIAHRDATLELRTVGESGRELRSLHPDLAWSVIGLASTAGDDLDEALERAGEALLASQTRTGAFAGAFPWSAAGNTDYSIWSTFRSVHAISLARQARQRARLASGARTSLAPAGGDRSRRPARRPGAGLRARSLVIVPVAAYLVLRAPLAGDVASVASWIATAASDLWRQEGGWNAVKWAVVCSVVASVLTRAFTVVKRRITRPGTAPS